MSKYRIRVFSSFCDSSVCKEVYERLCESGCVDNYGKDKEIYFTNEDDYTHVIIMNTAMPNLKPISKENVIGMAIEPPQYLGLTNSFIHYAEKFIGKYFIGETFGLSKPFIEYYSFMWHNPLLKHIPIKNKMMSIMVSQKLTAPGHQYRHTLVKRILESKLPIDIYGKGCTFYKNDIRIKGEFSELEPYVDYQFHIAIENFSLNHYFSEKITNTLHAGTTPIYLGCKNIHNYFPNMVITLSHDIDKDMQLLTDIISNPEKHRTSINVDTVKNKTNLLLNIKNIFPNK